MEHIYFYIEVVLIWIGSGYQNMKTFRTVNLLLLITFHLNTYASPFSKFRSPQRAMSYIFELTCIVSVSLLSIVT